MRITLAAVAALGLFAVPALPGSAALAQYRYDNDYRDYRRDVRRAERECQRDLRRAANIAGTSATTGAATAATATATPTVITGTGGAGAPAGRADLTG